MSGDERPTFSVDARRVAAGTIDAGAGDFTYTVVVEPQRPEPPRGRAAAGGDRRRATRQRTRLRSAKIVDGAGAFVTDCLVHDLSATGGRLRLPAGIGLPRSIQIYDDQTGHLHRAIVLWRRDGDVGVSLAPPRDDPRTRAMAEALRRNAFAAKR